jgi:hypothetical protein
MDGERHKTEAGNGQEDSGRPSLTGSSTVGNPVGYSSRGNSADKRAEEGIASVFPTRPKRRLVEVLVGMGIPKKTLTEAADEYYEVRFGKWLVDRGHISQEQLNFALAQQAYEVGDYDSAQAYLLELSTSSYERFVSRIEEAARAFQGMPTLIASAIGGRIK